MRVDDVDPAQLTEEQRAIYQRYATGPRAAPDNPFLLVDADGRLQGPPAVLLVAHDHDSTFELYAHRRAGAAAGLTEADLEALAQGREPAELSDVESCVLRTVRRILDRGTLDDNEFRDAAGVLGKAGLFELVTIVGYYTMVAWQLAVFDIQAPDLS